jgi:hypothetical protein
MSKYTNNTSNKEKTLVQLNHDAIFKWSEQEYFDKQTGYRIVSTGAKNNISLKCWHYFQNNSKPQKPTITQRLRIALWRFYCFYKQL